MVSHHGKPIFTKVVTEGRLLLEFTFDDLMRIRSWHFMTHQHHELVPRSVVSMQEPAMVEQLSQNITRQGLTNSTLNFLRLCVILEPMQELMCRHKVYGLSPRDCLKTTLFQKWQRIVAPPESARPAVKRRKKKGAAGSSASVRGGSPPPPGGGRLRKSSPGPPMFNNLTEDVMLVGEPTLMGGELGDEDERLISRLENNQFKPADMDESNSGGGMGYPSMHSPQGGGAQFVRNASASGPRGDGM
jgi:LIM domain-binding protein 1